MFKNAKTASGINGAVLNQNENAGGIFQGFDFEDFAINQSKLQDDIAEHISQHRTIRRLQRCSGCNMPKSNRKMSAFPSICRDCLTDLRGKGKTAQSNFIERAKANLGRSLRHAVVTSRETERAER